MFSTVKIFQIFSRNLTIFFPRNFQNQRNLKLVLEYVIMEKFQFESIVRQKSSRSRKTALRSEHVILEVDKKSGRRWKSICVYGVRTRNSVVRTLSFAANNLFTKEIRWVVDKLMREFTLAKKVPENWQSSRKEIERKIFDGFSKLHSTCP